MKAFSLPAGTIVHIGSLPFRLVEKAIFEGHPANVEAVTREPLPYEPDVRNTRTGDEQP